MKMIFNDFFNRYRTELDTYIPKYIYEYGLALFRLMRDVRLEMLERVCRPRRLFLLNKITRSFSFVANSKLKISFQKIKSGVRGVREIIFYKMALEKKT